jgi:uncharacterized pyridoxal phosphate-containing UPF0001 family protein
MSIARHIVVSCKNLQLSGLMTIGAVDDSLPPSTYFKALAAVKVDIERELDLKDLELSMGMSGDWEEAVEEGSTNIRVGSTIFGSRS